MWQKSDYVYWTYEVHDKKYERAGVIEYVIPPYKDPRKYIPEGFIFNMRGKHRVTESYVILIPGTKYLYWPNSELLQPLISRKWKLLYTQELNHRERNYTGIDRSDRAKIVNLCEAFGIMYDIEYVNYDDFISVPSWGRRFWFDVDRKNKYEYIYRIEDYPPILRH